MEKGALGLFPKPDIGIKRDKKTGFFEHYIYPGFSQAMMDAAPTQDSFEMVMYNLQKELYDSIKIGLA